MQEFSRFTDLPEYAFPRLRRLLKKTKGGHLHIPMHIGEPKHPFPTFITEKILQNLSGFNSYPVNEGMTDLLSAIANWLEKRYKLPKINPKTRIISLNGTREGLFNTAIALSPETKNCNVPAVLIPNPFYQCYMVAAKAIGAEPIFTPAISENGFLPDFNKLPPEILNRTVLCYICSPSNPQGAVANEEYWSNLFDLAELYDFLILADECYSEIYRSFKPIGSWEVLNKVDANPERLIVFNSLSKRSNLPGLRCGFAFGSARNIFELKKFKSYAGAPIPTPLQFAAEAAWSDEAHVIKNRALYKKKLELADKALDEIPGYISPDAGFFIWLPVNDGEKATKEIWGKYGVKLLPGSYLSQKSHETFQYTNPGKNYVRIALVDAEARVQKGLEAIASYFKHQAKT